jgi:hypothetical protein
MTKEEYSEQLKDPRWISKRQKILIRDKYRCKVCKCSTELEVHHLYYVSGHNVWEYPNDVLVTWCSDCHKHWHNTHKLIVRNKVFSEGKKKSFIPPRKLKRSQKNRDLRKKVDLFSIPSKDRRIIWKAIRRLSEADREKYLIEISLKYKVKS